MNLIIQSLSEERGVEEASFLKLCWMDFRRFFLLTAFLLELLALREARYEAVRKPSLVTKMVLFAFQF